MSRTSKKLKKSKAGVDVEVAGVEGDAVSAPPCSDGVTMS